MKMLKKAFKYRTLIFKVLWQLSKAHWQIHHIEFKKLSAQLGQPNLDSTYQPNQKELAYIKKIAAVTEKVGEWCRFKCFAKAIAAQRLLNKKNIPTKLYLGVHKKETELKAHAWLTCGDVFVTGKKGHEVFTSVIFYNSLYCRHPRVCEDPGYQNL